MIKKLEFEEKTPYLSEARGLGCFYKIYNRNGKCLVVISIFNAGDKEPVSCATIERARQWCQDNYELEVGKHLQNP